jgi:hypothetical protein
MVHSWNWLSRGNRRITMTSVARPTHAPAAAIPVGTGATKVSRASVRP